MSESLRNDGRIWVPKNREEAMKLRKKQIRPSEIPENARDYYLERRYPAFGNLVPRDVASRAAKERCDAGFGVSETGLAVYLDFSDAIKKWKEIADLQVTESLKKRASGMKLKKQVVKDGGIIELEDEIPPDTAAMIFLIFMSRILIQV